MHSVTSLLSVASFVSSALAVAVDLGTASTFGVIAADQITNLGDTVVAGSVGSVDRSTVGFPPGVATSVEDNGSASAALADAEAAAAAANALPPDAILPAVIGNMTLTPGVYKVERQATIEGTLILSGVGNFTFSVGNTLETVDGNQMLLADGAVATDVFWAIGNTMTYGLESTFQGTLFSASDILVPNNCVVNGGIFSAENISLDTDDITANTV